MLMSVIHDQQRTMRPPATPYEKLVQVNPGSARPTTIGLPVLRTFRPESTRRTNGQKAGTPAAGLPTSPTRWVDLVQEATIHSGPRVLRRARRRTPPLRRCSIIWHGPLHARRRAFARAALQRALELSPTCRHDRVRAGWRVLAIDPAKAGPMTGAGSRRSWRSANDPCPRPSGRRARTPGFGRPRPWPL